MIALFSSLILLQILMVVLQWSFIPYINTHLYAVVKSFGLLNRIIYISTGEIAFNSIH
jgi:hypothetical protein